MQLKFAFKASVEKDNDAARDHTHEVLELVYFIEGSGETTIEGKTYAVQNNCFCVMPANVIHNQVSETTITSICLGISGSGLESSQGLWVDSAGDIKTCLQNLMDELATQKIGYSIVADGYLLAAIGLVKRAIKENVPQDRKQAIVARALHIIDEKAGNLSIEDIAGQLFVSKDYLRHLFVHYTGQSPMRTIVQTRIENAQKLLANPDLTVACVAEMCGFDNPYYFSRMFKNVTGKSPSEYRRR